jgi:hypothetical protein
MDALHDPLVGCAGAMAPEQFDLNMIERVDIGGAKFGKGGGLRAKNASKAAFASGEFRRSLKILAS